MSQKVTRKVSGVIGDEKEKQRDSPVKDMKKKLAANAEKEKQVEKGAEKPQEKAEKPAEKNDKQKPAESNKPQEKKPESKVESKPQEKKVESKPQEKKVENKPQEKKVENKPQEKKLENKPQEKKVENKVENKPQEKKVENGVEKKTDAAEKNAKTDAKKPDKSKQNGKQNGDGIGVSEHSDDDVLEIADDEFPELTYDDNSDESPTPEGAHSRSATRRSQVKAARTPETPQPASDKPADRDAGTDQAKDKVLKMNEAPASDRKLRSDDPKPEKRQEEKKSENGDKDMDIVEIDDDEPRKTDTNYSKSRVKVSPYRRSTRLADQTATSITANYTGNNTTMEMDLTASSSFAEEPPTLDDSSYLSGLRSIRGRRSYKPLQEMTLRSVNRSVRSANASVSDSSSRPTGTVVGRKRKPDADDTLELGIDALTHTDTANTASITSAGPAGSKRMRLLDRIASPFRRTLAHIPAHAQARRDAQIVGINTDLPLTAPVAAPDPETLKGAGELTPAPTLHPAPTLTHPALALAADDKKRCVVM